MSKVEGFTRQQIAEQASAAMHSTDQCSQAMGMQIVAVGPGCANVEMAVREDFVNGQGYCHGGIITCLADTAFAHACNSYNRRTVAQGLSIEPHCYYSFASTLDRLLVLQASETTVVAR